MKTCIYAILLACFVPSGTAYSADSTLIQYHQSYKELSSMLSGSSPVSYERAVYLVENAWWGGNLDYNRYTRILDAQTTAIKLIAAGYHKPADSFTDAGIGNPQLLGKTAAERKAMHDKAVLNYAIYSYMRDTNLFVLDSSLYIHFPVSYTHADPMGSTQWANTQVGHLLATGRGNCYAMASLYKILADRLQTGAELCTAPGHIYIRHADENGIMYNVEPGSNNSFPGTGSMATLTYSSNAAIANGIAMRELDDKQAITMCLVYLAKGYEKQYNTDVDAFALQCATTALQYDANNLNAMLLQAEVLERRLLLQEPLAQLQQTATYKEYEALLTKLYTLGYREMPQDMKNTLVALYNKESIATNSNPPAGQAGKLQQNTLVGVSGGLFPETIPDRETEQYGSTLYNTKTGKITGFAPQAPLYNHYNFDPTVFAWNMDPLYYKMFNYSPYSTFGLNSILNIDKQGNIFEILYNVVKKDGSGYEVDKNGNYVMARLTIASEEDLKEAIAKSGNSPFVYEFVKGIEYLRTNNADGGVISDLIKHKEIIKASYHQGRGGYNPLYKTLQVDLFSATKFIQSNGSWGYQSPAVSALMHEFGHAWRHLYRGISSHVDLTNKDPKRGREMMKAHFEEEKFVTDEYQNKAAEKLGEDKLNHYDLKTEKGEGPIPVNSCTDTGKPQTK